MGQNLFNDVIIYIQGNTATLSVSTLLSMYSKIFNLNFRIFYFGDLDNFVSGRRRVSGSESDLMWGVFERLLLG